MGTFAGIFKKPEAKIPTDKVEEFEQRLEQLFWAGGMMEMPYVSMFGVNIETIRRPVMTEEGVDYTYNYFEDDSWENAGYNREKHRVYSEKVGWSKFNAVVRAAYVLEAMYLDGPAAAKVNGKPVDPRWAASWIAGLFGEPVTDKGTGPWDLYELIHKSDSYLPEDAVWDEMQNPIMNYADGEAGYTEWLSAAAVEKGTVEFAKEIGSEDPKEGSIGWWVNGLRNILHKFHFPEGGNGNVGTAETVMELLKKYYDTDMDEKEFEKECQKAGIQLFGAVTASLDMPPIVVKLIAEEYGLDFWKLWDEISELVRESGKHRSGEAWEEPLQPISTMDYLNLREDDMIPYWDGTGRQFPTVVADPPAAEIFLDDSGSARKAERSACHAAELHGIGCKPEAERKGFRILGG